MKKKFLTILIILLGALLASLLGFYGRKENSSLKDGEYEIPVTLEGGSGKTSLISPCKIRVENGLTTAEIAFDSEHYDYIILNGEKILPYSNVGGSFFVVPVENMDEPLEIIADTTAMSKPHEIEYKIYFGEEKPTNKAEPAEKISETEDWLTLIVSASDISSELECTGSLELEYARLFKVDYFRGGYSLVSIKDDGQYLIVPEGADVPQNVASGIRILKAPFDNIYVVGTGSMDFFIGCGCLDKVKFCSLKAADWELDEVRDSVTNGDIKFAGKYSAPDYEMILAGGCDLVIENNMITHTPQVREKLIELGFPVITEKASYEDEPLGRAEWIKLIGEFCGCQSAAKEAFDRQKEEYLSAAKNKEAGKDTPQVGIFYVTSDGNISIRRAGDYMVKMLEAAGGEYALSALSEENETGTMTVQSEAFLAAVKDADILIYNSSIPGEAYSIQEIEKLNPVLKNTKAFKSKQVYCTSKSLYQSVMKTGAITRELGEIISSGGVDVAQNQEFFSKLK